MSKLISKSGLDKVLRSSFREVAADKKAFIILVNGKRVQVSSGKKIWGSAGAAKNAINNHVSHMYNNRNIYEEGVTYEQQIDASDIAEEAIKEWTKQNIQVVSIGEYEAAQAKLKSK